MKSQKLFRAVSIMVLLVSFISINQPAHASTSSVDKLDIQIIDRNFPEFQDIMEVQPTISMVVTPPSINIGGTATVTVNLNNVPIEGYTSIELTCTYYPDLIEARDIVVADLFGADPVVAIRGPQYDRFIVAIAGSHGNKATNSGTVLTFRFRGLQAGQSPMECQARVSTGGHTLTSIASIGNNVIVLAPTSTSTTGLCDSAEFIGDVNVPPGTVMSPGATFIKTWRLQNVGSCTWSRSYQLVFFSGDQMSGPAFLVFPVNVEAGVTVDISLHMTAPLVAGTYHGSWMFKNANGALFGIGPQANEPWFADIVVSDATVTPAFTQSPPPMTPTISPTTVCDQAEMTGYVSIPPGTLILPGAAFTQSWGLKNIGSCAWTPAYKLVFYGSEQMDAPLSVNLPFEVAPGQSVILSVNFTAPVAIGRHTSLWRIRAASGFEFGAGPTGNDPLKVDIMVASPTVTPGGPTATPMLGVAYDFVANSCIATWFSGAGQLPCPGIDGNANGFVLKLDNPKLEMGTIDPRSSLLTFPQDIPNGYIQGFYPPFHVQDGDHFRSTLTCEFGATNCFLGYRLDYQVGSDSIKTFWGPFLERYDGRSYSADIDLSPLAGKDVKFILTVLSAGYATDDRALWVGPVIYRSDLVATATPTPTLTATHTPVSSSTPPISSNFIQVTSPNGGEALMVDSIYRITWSSSPDIATVFIAYKWSSTGMDWIASGIPNTGYYDWKVGVGQIPTNQIKIYIYGYGTADTSDESDGFITLLSPTPTVAPSGILTGQVYASKPVILELYNLDDSLVTSVSANADGTFSLSAPAGRYDLLASASGHLSTLGAATIIGDSASTQPPTKLLAGDVNSDTYIDQYDALTLGMNYNTALPSAADLNNDGIINVLDLELLARNYRKMGPVIWYGS